MLTQLRFNRKQEITLTDSITTTRTFTTTNTWQYGTAYSMAGYNVGTVVLRTAANASGAPAVVLQGSVDTTTYATITTLDTDITTTANNIGSIVEGLPLYCRVAMRSGTTATTHMRISVKMARQVCV
jgi:hypothetical protein